MGDKPRISMIWPAVGEDPMTGLPNLLALITDLQGPSKTDRLTIAGFDVKRLAMINREFGHDEGDRLILDIAESLVKATAALNIEGGRVYRLGGDEFCVLLPGLSHADDLIEDLRARRTLAKVRYAVVTCSCRDKDLEEAFLEVWPLLIDALESQAGARGTQMKRLARVLVDGVRETVELLKASRRLAYTDDISGLPNQRAARHLIREYLAKRMDTEGPLGLLFADGDNLKIYNDNLGYSGGNEMIRRLGYLISSETSPGELVARWLSGDEFMIILPGVGKKEALDRASNICRAVESQTAQWVYPVTISVGVASAPEDGRDLETLVTKLEEANARAKKMGKNCACGA
ncbi:MAG: diguanylate cyclase domain-containing protein [Bacillota bacterium]|nr:diguanylate cyclase [Candidatus Fermentithermobacillaceae bacterium]